MLSTPRASARSTRSAERRPRAANAASAMRDHEARRAVSIERRMRIAWALSRAGHDRRVMLALLLVERLTAAEAASALGVSVSRLRGFYRETLADLREAAHGRLARERARRPRPVERLRKAS